MTREQQKAISINRKNLESAVKVSAKKLGYKSVRGYYYKYNQPIIASVYIYLAVDRGDLDIVTEVNLIVPELNEIIWRLLGIEAENLAKPFSRHVCDDFTMPAVEMLFVRTAVPENTVTQELIDNEFENADKAVAELFCRIKSVSDFENEVIKLLDEDNCRKRYLETVRIICRLYENDNDTAYKLVCDAISRGENGNMFVVLPGGEKSLYDFIREQCEICQKNP